MKIKNVHNLDMAFGDKLVKVGEEADVDLSEEEAKALVEVGKIEIIGIKKIKPKIIKSKKEGDD